MASERETGRREAGAERADDGVAAGKQARTGGVQRKRRSEPVQRKGGGDDGGYVQELAGEGVAGAGESLPFMDVISQSFGAHDVSGVRAHTDDKAQAAASGMGAAAYATGDHVAFAGAPDLHTAAHEAAHVVQQRAGVQLKGGVGEVGDAYEQHADAVADAVVRGESAEGLLGEHTGGAAAAGGVQKKEIVKTGGPSHTEPDAAVLAMKISRFIEYSREQADWSTHFTGAEKPKLQQLLHDLLATASLASGLKNYTVTDVIALPAPDWAPVRVYCAAVDDAAGVPTAKMATAPSLARAIEIGKALPRLETAVGGGDALYHITKATDINWLIDEGRVDDFIKYCTAKSPQWMAPDGKEFTSFMLMKAGFYTKYPALSDVRNLHHFDEDALKRLNGDMLGGNAGKPLALILHSGLDHSGAFHHDGKLTTAITSNPNRVIMVEGKASLAEVEALLPTIAATYGGGVINEVMIAGHGESRVIEQAGTTKTGTNAEGNPEIQGNYDDLDLDNNAAATNKFLGTLLANMGGKDSRIVFNGCLTASNDIKIDPLNPDPPEKQIADQMAANGSLTDTMRAMAKAKGVNTTVLGANASFPEGPDLIDGAGNFDVKWSADPALTALDRKDYIKQGIEPTGVLRAVLEFWKPVGGATDWLDAVKDRNKRPTNDWDGAIITKSLAEIEKKPGDAQLISDLGQAVGTVAHGYFNDTSRASSLSSVPVALQPLLFGAVETSVHWPGEDDMSPIGFYSVWGKIKASKYDDLINHLTTKAFTTTKARPNLDWSFLDDAALTKLLPAAARAAPSRGHLVIACANVKGGSKSRVAIDFLKAIAKDNGNTFPPPMNVGDIADDSSVDGILTAIGMGAGSGGGGGGDTEVEANVDQNKDGKNDRYIERTAGFGEVVNCSVLRVHEGPGNAAKEIGFLKAGETVFVQGMRIGWCSIDFKGETGYVWNKFLRIT